MPGIDISALTTTNNYSNLFSSLGSGSASSNNNNNMGLGDDFLKDWAGIRNGSTMKLAKAYYGNGKTSSAKQNAVDSDEASAAIKANTALKSDANDLRKSIATLSDPESSLYTDKVTKTDENGNVSEDYDWDKISKAVKSFVDNYNDSIKSGADSDNKTVLRNTLGMTNLSKSYSGVLASAGITIGDGNKLSLDEDKLKKSGINSVKSLFTGTFSYADSIDNLASNVVNAVNAENNKLNVYTSKGSYSSSDVSGKIYDGIY